MEWQMTGGEAPAGPSPHNKKAHEPRGELREEDYKPELTEEDRMRMRLEEHDRNKADEGRDGVEEEEGQGAAVRGEKETAAEVVLEKSKRRDQ
jgi:hypothetical protein